MENWCFDVCRTLRPWLNAYVPSQGHAIRFPAVNLYLLHSFLNPDCLPQKFRGYQRLDTDTVELSVATFFDLPRSVSPIHPCRSTIRGYGARPAHPPLISPRFASFRVFSRAPGPLISATMFPGSQEFRRGAYASFCSRICALTSCPSPFRFRRTRWSLF